MARALRGLIFTVIIVAGLAAAVLWLRSRRHPSPTRWEPVAPAAHRVDDVVSQPPAAAQEAPEATPAEFTEIPEATPEPVTALAPEPAPQPVEPVSATPPDAGQGPIITEFAVAETVVVQLSGDERASSETGAGVPPTGATIIDYGVQEPRIIVLSDAPAAALAPESQSTVVGEPAEEPPVFLVDTAATAGAESPAGENVLLDAFERLATVAQPPEPGPPAVMGAQLESPASVLVEREPETAEPVTPELEAPPPPREPTPIAAAPSHEPTRSADSHLDEGNVYFNVGQYILAIECYSRAIEAQPDLVAAYYNRANARTRLGHYGQALADYDTALQLDGTDADALNNRGMLHLYRADYPAALEDFDRALGIDPGDTTIMVNRGLAHLHGGDPSGALADFTAASTADPGDAAAHYGCAQATATLGEREAAIAHLATALSLDRAYAREAAADPKLASLQGDPAFLRLLRDTGTPPSA